MDFPFHVKEHSMPTQHVREYARATANSQEDVLYLAIKQYIPKDNPSPQPGDITIIGTHANGFPKELYEPLWADLYHASKAHGFRIRSIWISDVVNQGYSGQLNELTMGNDPSWTDHSRDLLHMTNVFRSEMPRPLIGIGHSFGANCLTALSLLHPRLFTTLVLFDATIIKFGFQPVGPGITPAKGSAFRRELWPSAQEAAESFRRSPFYRSWDPRVLEAFIAHGIRPTPTALFPNEAPGTVTLATNKHQELFTFFRPLWPYTEPGGKPDRLKIPDFDPDYHDNFNPSAPFPFYRPEGPGVLRRLPEVRPSVLFVAGEASDLSTPEKRKVRLETCGTGPGGSGGAKAGRVAEVLMKDMGHLFPMEVPGQCAEHAAVWIEKEMQRWWADEREYEAWTKRGFREKTTMSEEFLDRVGRPPARKKKAPGGGQEKPKL